MKKSKLRRIIREELDRLQEITFNVTSKSSRQKAEIERYLKSKTGALYASHADGAVQVVIYTSEDKSKKYVAIWTGKRYKPEVHARYKNPEDVNKVVQQKIKNEKDRADYKVQRRADDARKKAELVSSIKPGDLFVASWGYEQTNIDFYKVIKVTGKSTVEIIKIGDRLKQATSSMSGEYYPDPKHEIGRPMRVRVTAYGLKIDNYVTARPTTIDKVHHKSWYG